LIDTIFDVVILEL